MASDREVQYQRTFVPGWYYDDFAGPHTEWGEPKQPEGERLKEWEIATLQGQDPARFENTRRSLAMLYKKKYQPGVNPSDEEVARCYKPVKWRGAIESPSGRIALPMPHIRFPAYRRTGEKGLVPVSMFQKTDQNFEKYATPWEIQYSNLIPPYAGWPRQFTPIVDDSWSVVGHYGMVNANNFIVPASYPEGNVRFGEDPVPVFVSTASRPPRGWKKADLAKQAALQVSTFIDGRVFQIEGYTSKDGVESVWYDPVTLFGIGSALVRLGRLGFRFVKALRPKGAAPPGGPTLGGPTEELAAETRAPLRVPELPPPRRIVIRSKHPRIVGEPDPRMPKIDQDREIHAANRYAERSDVGEIHLGDAARQKYNAPDGKFPDVVAKKMNGKFALSEGKGTDIGKMIRQFEAAQPKLPGIVEEQEVVVQKLLNQPVDGGVLRSPGPGFGVDGEGYLLDARGHVDLSHGLPSRVKVNGRDVRVIVIEMDGNIVGRDVVGGSRSPFPK